VYGKVEDARDVLRVVVLLRLQSMRSLKNMVLRLESDLLAVRLQLLEKKAKRVAATANQSADGSTSRCSSGRVSLDPGCEVIDAAN
jgi:hypothetical protein